MSNSTRTEEIFDYSFYFKLSTIIKYKKKRLTKRNYIIIYINYKILRTVKEII